MTRPSGAGSLLVQMIALSSVLLLGILCGVLLFFHQSYTRQYRDSRISRNQLAMEALTDSLENRRENLQQEMERLWEEPALRQAAKAGAPVGEAEQRACVEALRQWAETRNEVSAASILIPGTGQWIGFQAEPAEGEGPLMPPEPREAKELGQILRQDGALWMQVGFSEGEPEAILSAQLEEEVLLAGIEEQAKRRGTWPLSFYDGDRKPLFPGLREDFGFPGEEDLVQEEGASGVCYHLKSAPRTLVMREYSPGLGWYFIGSVQEEEILPPGHQGFAAIFPVLLFLLLLMLAGVLFLILRVYRPLHRLVLTAERSLEQAPEERRSGRNELETIQNALEREKRERETIRKLLNVSSEEIREKLVGRVLADSEDSPEKTGEWLELLESMEDSPAGEGAFLLLLLRSRKDREIYSLRVLSEEFWRERCRWQCFAAEEGTLGVVLCYPPETPASRIRQDVSLFARQLREGGEICLGYGAVENSFLRLRDTREEAREMLRRACEQTREEEEAPEDVPHGEQYRYVEWAQEYIQRQYADSLLSLDVVSEQLGISSPYLSSLMTRYLSMGFTEYLNRYRMEQARILLEDSRLSITEVGEKTGFSSLQNFGRVFKKYNGESAGQFRKKLLERQRQEMQEKEE